MSSLHGLQEKTTPSLSDLELRDWVSHQVAWSGFSSIPISPYRVAGRRLQYWHMDGLCSTDRGPTADNDYGALCRAIMEAHHIQRPLWAAMVRDWGW